MPNINRLDPQMLLEDIRNEQPFTFSRWGDGEWRSVLGTSQQSNCDEHAFFPKMQKQLIAVLLSKPQYMLGMQNMALTMLGKQIDCFIQQNHLTSLQWYDADVFHRASASGQPIGLKTIVEYVKTKPLVLVGPQHLTKVTTHGMKYSKFVQVPDKNCFNQLDQLHAETVAAVKAMPSFCVISISASMPAEILCDRLYHEFGHKHAIIDFGSLWDPLAGVKSRKYMRAPKWMPRVQQSIGENP